MNSYTLKIVQFLIENNGLINKDELIKDSRINKNKFYYYLNDINNYLSRNNLPRIIDDGKSLRYKNNELNKLSDYLKSDYYILNAKERQDMIILIIALSREKITINKLESLLDTSKNTITNDIYKIKENLKIKYEKNAGLYFVDDELKIRKVIFDSLHSNNNLRITINKEEFIEEEFYKIYSITNPLKRIKEILQKNINKRFIFFSIDSLAKTILVHCLRSTKAEIDLKNLNEDISEFKDIYQEMEKIFSYNNNEIKYLYLILQSAKIEYSNVFSNKNEVKQLLDYLTDGFERIYYTDIKNQEIYRMFKIHIESMYYRCRYLIKVSTFESETIDFEKNYFLNQLIKNAEKKFALYFDNDEKKLLAYYFEAMRLNDNKEDEKKKIIVLCASGLSGSAYVKYQLNKIFDNKFRIEISDFRDLKSKIDGDTVLIVSTIFIKKPDFIKKEIGWINVSVVLKDYDIKKMVDWIIDNPVDNDSKKINDIINIINNNSTIENKNALYMQLNKYLSDIDIKKNNLHLLDLIDEKYINYFSDEYNLEEAIEITGKPLVDDNIINSRYIEDVKETIECFGLYCECFKGIIIPHAKPHHNVKRPVISISIFKNSISNEYGKSINAIFLLGVVDKNSHIESFSELIEFLSKNNRYLKIKDYTNPRMLFDEIKDYFNK